MKEIVSRVTKTPEQARNDAASFIATILETHREESILFLSSGGSCIGILNSITDFTPGDYNFANVTVGVVDERVSVSEADSNYFQARNTAFFQKVLKHTRASITPPASHFSSPSRYAVHMERALRRWKEGNPGGIVVATLGIGTDGHIAGILPYPEDPKLFFRRFDNRNHWVVGYDAKDKSPFHLRSTLTFPALRELVNYAVVYAVGAEKIDAITRALAPAGDLDTTPARIIHEMNNVSFFTDVPV